MTQHYLLGEAARILGRRPHQIAYLITTGQVPEPERRIANKRLFTDRDVHRLARQLKVTPDWSVIERDAEVGEPEPIEGLALNPPFEVIRTGESGHEIRDADGVVFAWAADRARALVANRQRIVQSGWFFFRHRITALNVGGDRQRPRG